MTKIIDGIIFLLIAILSLGQLQRISFANQQVNFFVYEILMVLFIISVIVHVLIKSRFSFDKLLKIKLDFYRKNIEILRAVGLFILALSVSLLFTFIRFTNLENIVAAMYLGRIILYFIFFFYLIFYLDIEKNAIDIVKKSLTIFFILIFVLSVIQYFYYPDLRNLYYLGWDPHLYRLFGTYLDITTLGVVFTIGFLWFSKNRIMQFLSLLAIYFTYSRITYITFLTAAFYLYYKKINLKNILLVVCLFVAFLFILPRQGGVGVRLERTFSIESRITDLQSGLNVFIKQPVFGVGYNHIRYVKNTTSIHSGASYSSSYMTILVSSGIVGLTLLINLLFVIYKKINKEGRHLIFPILISSLFDNVLFTGLIFVLFLILIAINLSRKSR